jgi:hypothetical protein
MRGSKYRWTPKGGVKIRRRRGPPHWSDLHPAGLTPGADDVMPPERTETPQDGPEGQGGNKPLLKPEQPASTRPRPRQPGEYRPLKGEDDEGR